MVRSCQSAARRCIRSLCVENQIVPDGAERFELDLAAMGCRINQFFTIVLEDAQANRAWASPIEAQVTRS